ncbi:MAG TPA: helix-turn-helix transcriptional regulator [Clostridia bacterium]|nr:helix-turn-helix transcriptional regulator [Clostridia bacterium]
MSKELIAERLKAAREKAGLTQKQAGDALGVSYQAISNYERAATRIDVESLAILCRLYNVSLDEIVQGESSHILAAAAHLDLSNPEAIDEYNRFLDYLAYKYKDK